METKSAGAESISEPLITRLTEFFGLLRAAGLNLTPGRAIDAFRAVRLAGIAARGDFRLALRTNLASSRAEEAIFNRIFEDFWERRDAQEPKEVQVAVAIATDRDGFETAEAETGLVGQAQRYGHHDTARECNLAGRWPGESADMQQIVRQLARKLATRPSRRLRAASRGPRIDLRRSLRANLRHGMDMIVLARRRRKLRKTRLVLLCDVSGSMDEYNPFMLQLLLGLQRAFKNSRTVVFSVRVAEITGALRRQSVDETLAHVGRLARNWSGGTDIGAGLAHLNSRVMREGSARSTVVIVISDGYDQGDPAKVEREMRSLALRARSIVWINPLLATEGYAPVAKAMRASLPFIDHFMPANDVQSLCTLCSALEIV